MGVPTAITHRPTPVRRSGAGQVTRGYAPSPETHSAAAMSDTTLDYKFQKAGVPRHIGTQGSEGAIS